jgi:hypothetical protein
VNFLEEENSQFYNSPFKRYNKDKSQIQYFEPLESESSRNIDLLGRFDFVEQDNKP